MKILHKDLKQGIVKIQIDTMDDLWYLSAIVEDNDIIQGQTERKIKLGGATDRNQKVARKKVFLSIEVEKVEFHKYANILRVSGKINDGPEDIARGSYHTFNIEEGTIIKIKKQNWLRFQVAKLKEAAEQKQANILICIMDRETAHFALMKKYGYEHILEMNGNVQKKDSPEKVKSTFYADIIKQLEEYDERYKLNKIILASPGFWKEYVQKILQNKPIAKKIVPATCGSVTKKAFEEVLKRPETISALKDDRIVQEINLVEDICKEIVKEGAVSYGLKETAAAADSGAVKELLITDAQIQKMRREENFAVAEKIMKTTDAAGGNIHIISSDHEGGQKLDGLGGIAALLRYKVN